MLRSLGLILASYLVASIAATTTFWLVGLLPAGESHPGIALLLGGIVSILCLIPAVLTIAIGVDLGFKGWPYYTLVGIGFGFAFESVVPELMKSLQVSLPWGVMLSVGFVGGFVFWFVANGIGLWDPRGTRSYDYDPQD